MDVALLAARISVLFGATIGSTFAATSSAAGCPADPPGPGSNGHRTRGCGLPRGRSRAAARSRLSGPDGSCAAARRCARPCPGLRERDSRRQAARRQRPGTCGSDAWTHPHRTHWIRRIDPQRACLSGSDVAGTPLGRGSCRASSPCRACNTRSSPQLQACGSPLRSKHRPIRPQPDPPPQPRPGEPARVGVIGPGAAATTISSAIGAKSALKMHRALRRGCPARAARCQNERAPGLRAGCLRLVTTTRTPSIDRQTEGPRSGARRSRTSRGIRRGRRRRLDMKARRERLPSPAMPERPPSASSISRPGPTRCAAAAAAWVDHQAERGAAQ